MKYLFARVITILTRRSSKRVYTKLIAVLLSLSIIGAGFVPPLVPIAQALAETKWADTHITGTITNPNNALGNADGVWAGATNSATDGTSRWSMENTTAGTLSGTQTISVLARKGSNSGTPTVAINLYENGTLVQSVAAATNVTSTTGQVVSGTFNGSVITNANDVQIEVVIVGAGGSPSVRNSAQIDEIEWAANVDLAPTLSISQPDGTSDTVVAGTAYNITYSLADSDSVTTAAFYYDADNTGLNGTAITGACATAAEGTGVTCSWDTTGVAAGSYYVYGITSSGSVSAYSSGQITITAATPSTISSAANQTFEVSQATTSISTITATSGTAVISAANDIRIAIATSTHGMLWDTTDTTATIGGTASAKVSTTVSYEGGGSVLVIPVSTDFTSGETITISGLSYTSFTTVVAASAGLKLYLDGASDVTANATDDKTITIKGKVTLANHASGQVTDAFDDVSTSITADLHRFVLTNTGEAASTTLTFNLSAITGIAQADLATTKVYIEGGADVLTSPTVSISGTTGSISFTATSSLPQGANNYILRSTVSNLAGGDTITFALPSANIISYGTTSLQKLTVSGSASNSTHTMAQPATLSSAANQTFAVGDSATGISTMTITNGETNITAANDIRIAISTSTHRLLWDTTDTTATIGGTASGKVSTTVSYEGGGSVLVIPVNTNFAANDTLTVSGLSYSNFTAVNTATTGIKLFLGGASDTSADATDDKTIAIKGAGTLANHTVGQVGNKIDYSVTSTTTDFFRFKLSNTGEQASTTITFDLSGVSGISSADLSSFSVYKDTGNDGLYAAASSWAVAYDTAKTDVYGFIADPVNNVMYVGAKDGVIFRCPTSNGCNEAADWTQVFDDANVSTTGFYDLGFDSTNNVLYIGTIGTGIIYRCATSTGCDAQAEWTTSYDSAETSIRDFAFDPVNNIMYASTRSAGLIYRCNTTTLCDAAADWVTVFDAVEANGLYGMGYDSTNGVLYVGGGSSGSIYRCATSTGCDTSTEWTTAYDTTGVAILPFTFDSANGVMYAGEAGGAVAGSSRIFRCVVSTGCDVAGDWTVATTTSANQIVSLTFDSNNNAIYANGSTADHVYKCLTSTGCDSTTDWTVDYDGAGDFPWDIYYNANQNTLYRSINVTGEIFQKTLGEPIVFSGGVVNISGTSGTITFSGTTTLDQAATDYVLRGTVSNIVTNDTMTIGLTPSKIIQYGLTTGSLLTVSGSASSITHGTGSASPGTISIQSHAAGQITNAFGSGVTELTNASMYAFKLTPATENFTISRLAFVIMSIRGITQTDISSSTLIVDADNDGVVDAGETNVGGMGAVSFIGDAGTITFATTTTITLSTSTNYILRLNVANIAVGDEMTIKIYPGTITATGVTSGQVVVPADGVIAVLHRRFNSGSSAGSEIGGAAPAGAGIQTGGGTGGGTPAGGAAPAGSTPGTGGGSGGGGEI